MNTGLLWFDNDPKKSAECKIGEAAERYAQRFGVAPNVCHVHRPSGDAGTSVDAARTAQRLVLPSGPRVQPLSLLLVPNGSIRPDHYWLGQDDCTG